MTLIALGISVDDLDAACQRFEDLGVNWKKRLTDGRMKNVAFVLDPDNYCRSHYVKNMLELTRDLLVRGSLLCIHRRKVYEDNCKLVEGVWKNYRPGFLILQDIRGQYF